jgi:hypothetical protein
MGPWLIDVKSRDEIDTWLGENPPTPYKPVVMLVRGDGATVREFLPNALDAAKLDDSRIVAWVRDLDHISDDDIRAFFESDESIVAAVLSQDRQVKGWVYGDRTDVDDAAFAFDQADG